MAFVQYAYQSCTVAIPQSHTSAITMLVPASSNSFLLVRTDNSYELRSIRENTIVHQGKLPKQFIPCSLIKPINRCKEPMIYFNDRTGSICKLNIRDDSVDMRHMVRPHSLKESVLGKQASIEYKILDEECQYLLGCSTQTQSLNTNIFIYDWNNNRYSNTLTFTKAFYNFKIFPHLSMPEFESSDNKFVLFSTGEKHDKIHCAEIQLNLNLDKMEEKAVIELRLLERKQQNLTSNLFPIGGVYVHSNVFVVCNSPKKGSVILKFNIQQNASKQCLLQIPGNKIQRHIAGLFRKFLGIVDGNMLFSYKKNGASEKKLYGVQITKKLLQMQMNDIFQPFLVSQPEHENQILEEGELKDFDEITPSLDGFSFQQYVFECSSFRKKYQKEKVSSETLLKVFTTLRVPKKYNYFCLAEGMDLSQNMICQILELL